ncbi:MAG: VWA domain-containing protein [Saprospiraceae bacterium]|nr:VWA domain-containing protein [Saprospiraceae bacterium]
MRISLFAVLFVALAIGPSSAQDKERILPNCPMHIIIAMDFSASERAFIDEVQTVLLALTTRFELHPNSMRIGLVSFNRGAQMIQPLTGDTEELENTIEELRIPVSVFATDIHAGIDMANEEFQKNSLESVKKFFILISDGDPHAHSRGFGFQQDLESIRSLKQGEIANHVDPVHVFSLYSGETIPFQDPWSEEVRLLSIKHMQNLASSQEDFYFFDEYPKLVNLLEQISSCL